MRRKEEKGGEDEGKLRGGTRREGEREEESGE